MYGLPLVSFNHSVTTLHDSGLAFASVNVYTCMITELRQTALNSHAVACSPVTACGLWVVHHAWHRRHFSQTHSSSTLMLLSE
jgi:hypothetical protein